MKLSDKGTNKGQATTGPHYVSWLIWCPCLGMKRVTGCIPLCSSRPHLSSSTPTWTQQNQTPLCGTKENQRNVNNRGREFGHRQTEKQAKGEEERAMEERLRSGQQNKPFLKHLSDVSQRWQKVVRGKRGQS